MRSLKSPIVLLPLAISVLLVAGCAHREPTFQSFPRAEDLQPEAKPTLDPSALTSSAALNRHNVAVEGWGERENRKISRNCQWARDMGMKIDCTPKPRAPDT